MLSNLRDLIRGRIALLVSHRLWHAVMASSIIVLDHGSIVEEGSHEILLLRGHLYRELFSKQIAQYGLECSDVRQMRSTAHEGA